MPDGRGGCCHWGSPAGTCAALRSPQLSGRLPTSEGRAKANARASPGFSSGQRGLAWPCPSASRFERRREQNVLLQRLRSRRARRRRCDEEIPKDETPKMPLRGANALPVSSLLRKRSFRVAGCRRIPKAHPERQPCRRGRARQIPYGSCAQSARKHALLTRALQAGNWASGTLTQLGIESSMRNLEGCRQPMSHSRGPPIFGGPTMRTAWGRCRL